MKAFIGLLFTLAVLIGQVLHAQTSLEDKQRPSFQIGLAVEGFYRNFFSDSFLGDAYRMYPGYQLKVKIGYERYPGIGFNSGYQSASILDNQFLGGFFDRARFRDTGIFIFYDIPIGQKFFIGTDVGYGSLRTIHGERYRKFLLEYRQFFGNLGVKYLLPNEESRNYKIYLTGAVGFGTLWTNDIVINPFDRSYLKSANDVRGSIGILLELF